MQDLGKSCCTWIYGDVKLGTATWCGSPVRSGTPWCADHRQQVYVTRRHGEKQQRPFTVPEAGGGALKR